MAQRSNFRRQPDQRTFTGECPVHGEVDRSEVEQFDGSMAVRPCKQCQYHGLRVAPQGSDEHSQALANLRAESVNSALVGSGITPRFAESTLTTYRATTPAMDQALETCQGYADNFGEHFQAGRNLLLCGNVGNGKTHLASGIVQHVIRQHLAVAVITTAAEIIRVFKRSMVRDAGYTEGDVINELASFDLLVIDEVGAQAGTQYELGVLHEVFDRRYNLVRPTVVVSNLPARSKQDAAGNATPSLEQYIGARALDRLRENGALLVGFTWASARGRA
ncbi:ATP-binding protein [Pseudomonas sp. NFACC04-2]|uniref:ATP-binding protein n=1 Tax=Pseudomonas sp. NFACC04-2 TaxID=1566242 RepID=UPI000908E81F|nr:ATP-binding protein [Pseudomonas sp. NFACC04-2]SFW77461.1 DNA replication protein DnaC [Pseudomonas sp. NFACC04-2]